MIRFIKEYSLFDISGKDYTYIMKVNDCGYLQGVYYGAKLAGDYHFLMEQSNVKSPKLGDINMDMAFDTMPSECGFYLHGDFREPTIIIERKDGGKVSRFKYLEHSIVNGATTPKGLPHVRIGKQTLMICLYDEFSNVKLHLYYTCFDNSNALVRWTEIVNEGETAYLKRAYSFCLDLPKNEYNLLNLYGNYNHERMVEEKPLGHGITKIQSLRGKASHQTNPFLAILNKDTNEDFGECYGFQLMYSGSFSLSCEVGQNEDCRVQGGIADLGFSWKLENGEKFHTPQAVLVYSKNGLGDMSITFADFYKDYVILPQFVKAKRPLVINNWEATYFDFNTEKLKQIVDDAVELGIDTFVLDDGWFGVRNDDTSGLGDWFVNESKLQGGLKAITDYCKEKGVSFGLWFEPEMISENSELFRIHPEFAICKKGVEPCRGRNQLVLDFTNPKIVNHIFDLLDAIISKYNIKYIKWDMNRDVTEGYSQYLDSDSQGEFYHRYTLGVYSLAEKLTSKHPDLFIESCSGGGARFDGGMLYYAPQSWTSDNTDGRERVFIQWGTSMCYPVSAISCHVSECPNHQNFRITPFKTRGHIASLGPTGYELDLSKLTEDEKSMVKKQISNYKNVADLVLEGDFVRLKNPFKSEEFAAMLVSKNKEKAYVVYECLKNNFFDGERRLRLKHLNEDCEYYIHEYGQFVSGRTLMNYGVKIPRLEDFETFSLFIERRNKNEN